MPEKADPASALDTRAVLQSFAAWVRQHRDDPVFAVMDDDEEADIAITEYLADMARPGAVPDAAVPPGCPWPIPHRHNADGSVDGELTLETPMREDRE